MAETFTPKSFYTREELIASGQASPFGVGNAQLPAPPMLMMDRVTEITTDGGAKGRGSVRAELDIDPDLWFFQCHFKKDPVMPGCLGLDAMWQLLGFYLLWSGLPGIGRALGAENIKFSGKIVTKTSLVKNYCPAEEYHQKYFDKNK